MIELKHTKGPWSKDYNGTIGHIKTLCDPEKHTKTVIKYRYNLCEEILTEDEIEANARLISCAPDFIEDKIKDFKEIGKWLSAALTDPEVCTEMKTDISNWFKRFDTFEKATGYKISEVIE